MGRDQLRKSEWKQWYPVKKAALLVFWLSALFLALLGIWDYWQLREMSDGMMIFLCAAGVCAVTFKPILKYLLTPYHCVPYFNQIFTRQELEKLFEPETFSEMTFLKEYGMDGIDMAESGRWFRINWQYVSKELAVLEKMYFRKGRKGRTATSVWIMYLTGDRVKVELKTKLPPGVVNRFNRYIWQETGILPQRVLEEEEEKLNRALRDICRNYRKEHGGMPEKEMLNRHIREGGDLRRACEDAFPSSLKEYRDELLQEGDLTLTENESDKNEMLQAVLKKKESYRCRLYGEFTASGRASKRLGRWLLSREPYVRKYCSEIDHSRCYLGMTQRRLYVLILGSLDAKRISEKLAIPLEDIVKTEIERQMEFGRTTVILHARDFKVKLSLPEDMDGTDLQGQKENIEKFCRMLSEL